METTIDRVNDCLISLKMKSLDEHHTPSGKIPQSCAAHGIKILERKLGIDSMGQQLGVRLHIIELVIFGVRDSLSSLG